jgi:hypothetical protein
VVHFDGLYIDTSLAEYLQPFDHVKFNRVRCGLDVKTFVCTIHANSTKWANEGVEVLFARLGYWSLT